jgi:3-deoxy-D-manno-octulosonic-acid transferase
MVLFFYNLALLLGLAVSLPWWLWRMATTEKYRAGIWQRLWKPKLKSDAGPAARRPLIWLHAVSVGEVLAVSRLVQELTSALPDYRVAVSTTTRTGYELAYGRLGADRVFYSPLDLPWAVRNYLEMLKPTLLILAETEFWPNLLSGCFRRRIPVMVVNARISDRSWPRYLRLRRWWRPFLSRVSRVLAQSETDAERLTAIGCEPERTSVAGNLKFDVRAPSLEGAAQLFKQQGEGLRFVVAGSTLEGEEAALVEAWPKLLAAYPNLVLVVAPRHPERFNDVAALLKTSGVSWVRRSEWPVQLLSPGEVILLDTIGELASVYSLASAAFVGGSLVEAGGHNPLEPAQFGVPVVMGPSYQNFRTIVDTLLERDALRIVEKDELAAALIELLTDRMAAQNMGERARHVFEQQAGATRRCVEAIQQVIAQNAILERPL